MASVTSAIPAVASHTAWICKEIWRKSHDVLMDGRDIGTNILPTCTS
ncbi:MAG: hypothetical protein ACLTTO_08830 [Lachnospiraceae bacterium]